MKSRSEIPFAYSRLFLVFILFAVICLTGCVQPSAPRESSADLPPSTEPSNEEVQKHARIDCSDLRPLTVTTTQGKERRVEIKFGESSIRSLIIPYQSEMGISGFALNWVRKTQSGFEISIEYGSRMYYGKRLSFVCRGDQFVLSEIHVESFDKHDPDKWTNKKISVKPVVALSKFELGDYLKD